MSVGVSWGGRSFSDALEGMTAFSREFQAAWDGEPRKMQNVVRRYLKGVMDDLAKRHGQPWPGGTSDTSLSRRTGETVQALTRSVSVTGTTWEQLRGAVRLPSVLAIHEYGGTIQGKGKMLTIPLPAALSSNGTPKRPRARDWENTFVAMSRRGNLIIFQRRGRQIVPLYVLRDSVRIRPRLGVGKAIEAGAGYFQSAAVDQVVKDIMQRLGGP